MQQQQTIKCLEHTIWRAVLLNSPKMCLKFPCKEAGNLLFFILDNVLCVIIRFIPITKQFILCGKCKANLHTDKWAGAERVNWRKIKIDGAFPKC